MESDNFFLFMAPLLEIRLYIDRINNKHVLFMVE